MALSGGTHGAVLSALALAPGSRRLIALRWGLVVVASLPALIATLATLSRGPALSPYFTAVEGPLPFAHLLRLLSGIPVAIPMALVAVILAVVGDQFLTVGAVRVLTGTTSRVWGAVFRDARGQVWPMLRLVLMGAIAIGLGVAAISRLGRVLRDRGMHEGWPGMTQKIWVPLLTLALILMWTAAIGAWALWARTLAVTDKRRCARRAGWLALRALWRHPVSGLATFVFVTVAAFVGTGALLAAWFAAEPATTAGVGLWILAWLLALLGQAYVWHWMVRTTCMMGASPGLDDLRAAPDQPFRLLRRGWAHLARRLRRRPTDALDPVQPPDAATPGDTEPTPPPESDGTQVPPK